MKRRRILLALLLVLAAAVVFLAWPRGPKEPVYGGRKLSVLLEEAFPTRRWESQIRSSPEQPIALKALKSIDTNALPWLLQEFNRHTPAWRETLNRWLAGRGWRRHGIGSDQDRRDLIARAFSLLGAEAEPILPALAAHLGTDESSDDAVWAMSGVGEPALPFFTRACISTNLELVLAGSEGLHHLAYCSPAARTQLVSLLNHAQPAVRLGAAASLAGTRHRPDLVMPVLVRFLTNGNQREQSHVISSLGLLETDAKPAVPDIQPFLTNQDPWLVREASNALLRIDPAALRVP